MYRGNAIRRQSRSFIKDACASGVARYHCHVGALIPAHARDLEVLKQFALAASILAASGHWADAKVVEETISVAVEVATIRGEVVRRPIR